MSGRILIVETTASQRIFLRACLESAHYAVQATADLEEAAGRVTSDAPDLILLDIASERLAALAFCAGLRDASPTAALPVIALDCQPNSASRLDALRAGADDVLEKRGDGAFLLARIRSLLRVRDASAEFALRDGAARALGMAEAARGFIPAGRTAIVTRRPGALPPALSALAARLPGGVVVMNPDDDISADDGTAQTDLFLIDHGGRGEASSLFRLIADLQSRKPTRHAKTMVLVSDGALSLAEMALDLGADDLVTESAGVEELAFRVRSLLRRKSQADRLRDRLQSGIEAALTDPLTGLHNRRYAMAELGNLTERQAAGGGGFSVVILDIDHFKQINDTHGHAAGDLVLRMVAGMLRANLRCGDLVARIGGEEFLVALPGVGAEAAHAAAERLRRAVETASIDLCPRGSGPKVQVTLSAGVATGGEAADAPDPVAALCARADRALYAAKSAGRNMVTVAQTAA